MSELHLLSPRGFRAAGVYAGIKSTQTPDVGLLTCDRLATAAAAFTTNTVVSPGVTIGRRHIAGGTLRGVVVNSGNANACTGRQGEHNTLRMCRLASEVFGCTPEEVLPSSTGIIGRQLPMDKLERGIVGAGHHLGDSLEHAQLFGSAILTTDLKRKSAAVQIRVGRETITLAGVCKGSGMIGPRLAVSKSPKHATMLAYLTTDADITAPLLRKMLSGVVDESFNCVTVDDHASTNDTAAMLASGIGAKVTSGASAGKFVGALRDICQSLAYQIAADGEGATKVVAITVRQARSVSDARAMARAIANSPLVKCAMHGNDPNWGRIVSAAGMCGARFDADRSTLTLQGVVVFRHGQPVAFDAEKASRSLRASEVQVDLACRLGRSDATCWTCDLSKDYVTINADYHT